MVIGLPLVFIFYFGVMSLGFQSAAIIFLKQAINGITNALIAGILISRLPLSKWFGLPSDRPPVPYSRMIFSFDFGLSHASPDWDVAFYQLPGIKKPFKQWPESCLFSESKVVNGIIHSWLERHIAAVKGHCRTGQGTITFSLRKSFRPTLSRSIRCSRTFIPYLLPMIRQQPLLFFPPINKKGEKTIGMNFADRGLVQRTEKHPKTEYLRCFFRVEPLFSCPFFTISFPIVAEGKLSGFGLGVVNLEKNAKFAFTQRPRL